MVRRGSTVRVRQRASRKPCKWAFLLSAWTQRRRLAGTRRVHFRTRGHSRARAASSDHRRSLPIQLPATESACKQAVYIAGAGAEATTSFARDGSRFVASVVCADNARRLGAVSRTPAQVWHLSPEAPRSVGSVRARARSRRPAMRAGSSRRGSARDTSARRSGSRASARPACTAGPGSPRSC